MAKLSYFLNETKLNDEQKRKCLPIVNFASKASSWGIMYIICSSLVLVGSFLSNPRIVLILAFGILLYATTLMVIHAVWFFLLRDRVIDFIKSIS